MDEQLLDMEALNREASAGLRPVMQQWAIDASVRHVVHWKGQEVQTVQLCT